MATLRSVFGRVSGRDRDASAARLVPSRAPSPTPSVDSTCSSSTTCTGGDAPFVACHVQLGLYSIMNPPLVPPDSGGLCIQAHWPKETRMLYQSRPLDRPQVDSEGDVLDEVRVDGRIAFVLDDIGRTLHIELTAKNKWRKDDVLDRGIIELNQLLLFTQQRVPVQMSAAVLCCSVQIQPITQEQKDEFLRRNAPGVEVQFGRSASVPGQDHGSLCVTLINGANIGSAAEPPDAVCKFRLGNEKHKSRVIPRQCNPEWSEEFEMRLGRGVDILHIQVVCRRQKTVLHNGEVHLSGLAPDVAHRQELNVPFGDGATVSIIVAVPSPLSELVNVASDFSERYALSRTFAEMPDVGELVIKVVRAENVEAKDMNGKSDPFAIVRLGNLRVRTHTHYATLNPEWNRLFILAVEDVHACLDISLFDEDANSKAEFLGRVAIPLLSITGWERRWVRLKDRKLLTTVRGRLLIELRLQYNLVRAVIRTFNPREKEHIKPPRKFKPSVLKSTVTEMRRFAGAFSPFLEATDAILRWKRPARSVVALVMWVFALLYIEPFHLPLLLLALIFNAIHTRNAEEAKVAQNGAAGNGQPPVSPTAKENESGLSILAISETLTDIQDALLFVTRLLQRRRNASNMTAPWLTWLLIAVLSAASFLLYLVPIRYIILAWGVNKITKRLRKPDFIDNNEVLDYLSRVPCDRQLMEWREEQETTLRTSTSDSLPSPPSGRS